MTPEERVWKEELEADIEREKEGERGLSGTVQAPIAVPRPGEPPLEGSPNPSVQKHISVEIYQSSCVFGDCLYVGHLEICPTCGVGYCKAHIGLHVHEVGHDGSGTFGPRCECHGKRNMERLGKRLYCCQESGLTFELQVDAKSAQGYTMVPLEGK